MSEGSLSPIIVKYEKLLEDDPRSRSFAPLAEAYRQVGLLDKAFDVLKKGLRYNPEYLLGYLTLALCYFDKKEFGLAYSTLKPLIAQNRDNLKLQRVFAECAKKTNNLEEALDSYKYLLFLNPKDREIANQVALLEEELHEEAIYAKKESPVFDVEGLKPNPEDDKEIDNWVQVDLSNKIEESNEEDHWSVGTPLEESSSSSTSLEFERDGLYDEDTEIIYEKSEKVVFIDEQENKLERFNEFEDSYDEENSEDDYDDESDNLISFERKSNKDNQSEIVPVITHTLVDIYLKQGHYTKAKEILERIIEVGPATEEAQKKLEEIEKLVAAENPKNEDKIEEIKSEDEGRNDLMAAFDKSFGSLGDDDEDEEELVSTEANAAALEQVASLDEFFSEVDLVLSDYLAEIKQRQVTFRD